MKYFLTSLMLIFVITACDNSVDEDENNVNNTNNINNVNNTNNVNNANNVNNINNVNNSNNTNNINNSNNTNNINPETNTKVDLLFVIDNSLSMQNEQENLINNFNQMVQSLNEEGGELPDIHIGITSTDLGTSPYNIPSCETIGGHNGSLLKGMDNSCINPSGQNYIVDVKPQGCNISRDEEGQTCLSHDCLAANCDLAGEPDGLQLYLDENGCPRCRNYADETLPEVFSCNAELGIQGCGFEQPLEAMKLTFDGSNQENLGFYRSGAKFAVIIISDEDDCSASSNEIFSTEQNEIDSTLGPLSSFRCTEFGVVCDEDWNRLVPGGEMLMHNCISRPQSDELALLHPISRYIDFLTVSPTGPGYSLDSITAAALAGPFTGNISVILNQGDLPAVASSCTSADTGDGAIPAVRIKEFVNALTLTSQTPLFHSICEENYGPSLELIAQRILQ